MGRGHDADGGQGADENGKLHDDLVSARILYG
jgi:hypothetical protein